MPEIILHHNCAYQIFSTVSDGPCYESALTREQLEGIYRKEYGESGMRQLPQRLERAHGPSGSSSVIGYNTIQECATAFRYHSEEGQRLKLTYAGFIERYLTLPKAGGENAER